MASNDMLASLRKTNLRDERKKRIKKMKKAGYTDTWEEYTDHYIGRWLENHARPQPIYLYVTENSCSIKYNPYSNCQEYDEFVNKKIIFDLHTDILTKEEAKEILNDCYELIDLLQETYDEKYNGQNNMGIWDQSLCEELQTLIDKKMQYFESEISWFDEEELE